MSAWATLKLRRSVKPGKAIAVAVGTWIPRAAPEHLPEAAAVFGSLQRRRRRSETGVEMELLHHPAASTKQRRV
jgi:hypothetical protein